MFLSPVAHMGHTRPFMVISTSGSMFGAAFKESAKRKGHKYLITDFLSFLIPPWMLERCGGQSQLLLSVDGFLVGLYLQYC